MYILVVSRTKFVSTLIRYEIMKLEDKKKLLELLKEFFAEYDVNARDALWSNPIFRLLKLELGKKGRWKQLPGGKRGYFRR